MHVWWVMVAGMGLNWPLQTYVCTNVDLFSCASSCTWTLVWWNVWMQKVTWCLTFPPHRTRPDGDEWLRISEASQLNFISTLMYCLYFSSSCGSIHVFLPPISAVFFLLSLFHLKNVPFFGLVRSILISSTQTETFLMCILHPLHSILTTEPVLSVNIIGNVNKHKFPYCTCECPWVKDVELEVSQPITSLLLVSNRIQTSQLIPLLTILFVHQHFATEIWLFFFFFFPFQHKQP